MVRFHHSAHLLKCHLLPQYPCIFFSEGHGKHRDSNLITWMLCFSTLKFDATEIIEMLIHGLRLVLIFFLEAGFLEGINFLSLQVSKTM